MFKKKNHLSVVALVVALAALALSVIGLLPGQTSPDQSFETPALEQQVQALQAQVDALTAQLAGASGDLADWNLSAASRDGGERADVTLTALPSVYETGMEAIFTVLLDGQEVASQPCILDGNAFCATLSLPAADGYAYYCILLTPDGSRRQVTLTTPGHPVDEHMVNLKSSLESYCLMTVEGWSLADQQTLLIPAARIEVQLPLISLDAPASVTAAELVLTHNGSELSRLSPETSVSSLENGYLLEAADICLPLPAMAEGDVLEMILLVTLSDGTVLSTPGASWYLVSGELQMVVG